MAEKPHDKIIIRDMTVMMSVGIHAFEKEKTQRVVVNVEISVNRFTAPDRDDIATVLSYADIVADIEALAQSSHINLLETFAERIAMQILNYSQAIDARVRVEKPDIFQHIAGIGVEIVRARPTKC